MLLNALLLVYFFFAFMNITIMVFIFSEAKAKVFHYRNLALVFGPDEQEDIDKYKDILERIAFKDERIELTDEEYDIFMSHVFHKRSIRMTTRVAFFCATLITSIIPIYNVISFGNLFTKYDSLVDWWAGTIENHLLIC